MRVEPFAVGDYLHVLKRGGRGMEITKDYFDKTRFLHILYYMNDEYLDENWVKIIYGDHGYGSRTTVNSTVNFERPPEWPERKPIVKILCYTLMPNHLHLLLKEILPGGVSKFMQKIGMSMTNHFNEKYKNKGSIFQGGYKSKTIKEDKYLRYLSSYIMVKNTFELYPEEGLIGARKNFNKAWEWAKNFEFSSLGEYCDIRDLPIIEKDVLGEIFTAKNFKFFSRDVVLSGKWDENKKGEFASISIE